MCAPRKPLAPVRRTSSLMTVTCPRSGITPRACMRWVTWRLRHDSRSPARPRRALAPRAGEPARDSERDGIRASARPASVIHVANPRPPARALRRSPPRPRRAHHAAHTARAASSAAGRASHRGHASPVRLPFPLRLATSIARSASPPPTTRASCSSTDRWRSFAGWPTPTSPRRASRVSFHSSAASSSRRPCRSMSRRSSCIACGTRERTPTRSTDGCARTCSRMPRRAPGPRCMTRTDGLGALLGHHGTRAILGSNACRRVGSRSAPRSKTYVQLARSVTRGTVTGRGPD